jgi:superfamily II DNA or RNA helicase
MQKRKQLCYNAVNKIKVSKQILEKYPKRKALIFSESIAFADKLQLTLGAECVTFHSKLGIKSKRKALEDFSDATSEVRVISSVKALNAGLNVPDCSLGVCAAGSSKALDNIQRKGRTLRKTDDKFKVAVYINIYVKGSQELKWVRKRTEKDHSVKWIESLEEMIEE